MTTADPALASGLRVSVLRLSRRMRQERSADTPLSATQVAALATLERHGPLTLGELAGYEKVQPPSMTRVVAHLSDRGLATRGPSSRDGRLVVAEVTAAGRALLAGDRRRRDEWLAARLAELPASDVELLRAAAPVLERLAGS